MHHPTSELYESLSQAFEHFNGHLFQGELPQVIFTVQRIKGVMGYFAAERWGNLEGAHCHEIAINPTYLAHSRLIEIMQTLVHEMVHCWQFCFGEPGRAHYHNKEWAKKMIEVGLMPSSSGEPGGAITGQHMSDYIIDDGAFLQAYITLKARSDYRLSWIDRRALPRLYEHTSLHALDPETSEMNTVNQFDDSATISEVNSFEPMGGVKPYSPKLEDISLGESLPPTFIENFQPKKQTRVRYVCDGCQAKIYGKPGLRVRCMDCIQDFQ